MTRRSSLLGLLVFAPVLTVLPSQATAQPAPMPARFYIPARIQPTMSDMLGRSPTFSRQCRRIVEAGVIVVVAFENPFVMPRGMLAHSTIVRKDGQVTFARVTLRPDVALALHLAHELEHIVEQVEGVDLARLAKSRRGDAWTGAGGAFETRRARDAGKRVNSEVKNAHPPTLLALQAAVTPVPLP